MLTSHELKALAIELAAVMPPVVPAVSRKDGAIELDADQVALLRHVLLVGLSCAGELDRLLNAHEVTGLGEPWPKCAIPRDQHGDAEMVSKFAEVLRYVS
jgi:hypothetical protein